MKQRCSRLVCERRKPLNYFEFQSLQLTTTTTTTTTKKKKSQSLVPKFWGQLWILNKVVRASHIYSFLPFYSIHCHVLYYFKLIILIKPAALPPKWNIQTILSNLKIDHKMKTLFLRYLFQWFQWSRCLGNSDRQSLVLYHSLKEFCVYTLCP